MWLKGRTGIPLPVTRHVTPLFQTGHTLLRQTVCLEDCGEELPSSEPVVDRSQQAATMTGADDGNSGSIAFVGEV